MKYGRHADQRSPYLKPMTACQVQRAIEWMRYVAANNWQYIVDNGGR